MTTNKELAELYSSGMTVVSKAEAPVNETKVELLRVAAAACDKLGGLANIDDRFCIVDLTIFEVRYKS